MARIELQPGEGVTIGFAGLVGEITVGWTTGAARVMVGPTDGAVAGLLAAQDRGISVHASERDDQGRVEIVYTRSTPR